MAHAESPSSPPAGDTAYLYRAALGPGAQDYYLRQFARFDGEGRAGASWNWAAYWATLNWLIYRRMWGWALAYVAALAGLALLIFGVGKLLLDYSATSAWLLFLGLLTAAFVVPGLYGNAWLYHHLNERISAALRDNQDVKAAATVLAAQAPDRRRLLLLALANAVLLALAGLLAQLLDGADSALPQPAQAPPPSAAPAVAALASASAASVPGALQRATAAATGEEVASAPAAPASAALTAAAPASAPPSAAASAPSPARVSPQSAAEPLAGTAASAAQPASKPASAAVAAADPAQARAGAAEPERAAAMPARPLATAAQTPAQPAAVAVAPTAPPAPAAARARLQHVWVIQVGAYADAANAERALAQVQGLGLEAGAESFEAPGKGRLTRVRVGPFTRQAEAEQAALRIKALDLPVLVIRQRP